MPENNRLFPLPMEELPCGLNSIVAALWGGYIECLYCVANKTATYLLCHELQERDQCDALKNYQGRLDEASVPQPESGTTVRIQLDQCQGELDSSAWCSRLLEDLCQQIGMTPLAGPLTKTLTHPTDPSLSGVSSTLIIQESHLAVHTWPTHGAVRVVVDTCGEGLRIQETSNWLMKRVGAKASRVFVAKLFESTFFR